MTFRLPPLTALRGFEAAARLGSFKAAAAELLVTPSAVSHQVANLETYLKTPLFHRDGRGLTLNEAGDAYRHRLHDILDRLAQATADVRAGAAVPTLGIVAAPSFAGKWLMPRLDGFLQAHPELRVRVEATASRRTLGDADMGIIYGDPATATLTSTPLIAERLLPLCAPSLLGPTASLSVPPMASLEDLASKVLIHARNQLQWPAWLAARGVGDLPIRREMWVDRSSMGIDAAVQGLGVILESDFLAADELRAGILVPAFGAAEPAALENAYFLVARGDAMTEPMTNFAAWLMREIDPAHRAV